MWNPVRVEAGSGALDLLPNGLPEGPVLLVTTAGFTKRGLTNRVCDLLRPRDVVVFDAVRPNPQLDDLDAAVQRFASRQFGVIVAVGGGSAIDTAKALSVALPSGVARPLDRVLRNGEQRLWGRAIPVVAVPTTAGTGAEVTPFATVWDSETHAKHSVAGDLVYPVRAILDPTLTLTVPPDETVHSGLDAVSHALESVWNKHRTPVSLAYSVSALRLAVDALPKVLRDPADLASRTAMQQASLLSGLAISQTRTAIAHSISYPLTSRFGVPHGLACSFTLPELLNRNFDLLMAATRDRTLWLGIQAMLALLALPERVKRYVSVPDVLARESEMQTVGRFGNYIGCMGAGVRDLLEKALAD